MLARVNEDRLDLRVALHFAHQRRDFDQVRARADNVEELERFGHARL